LSLGLGVIEIKSFSPSTRSFHSTIRSALDETYRLGMDGGEVFFSAYLRACKSSTNTKIKYVHMFHSNIVLAERNISLEKMRKSIEFFFHPTFFTESNEGFHFYWMLSKFLDIKDVGITIINNMNKILNYTFQSTDNPKDCLEFIRFPGIYDLQNPKSNKESFWCWSNNYTENRFADFAFHPWPFKKFQLDHNKISEVKNKPKSTKGIKIEIDKISISSRMKSLILGDVSKIYQNDPVDIDGITVIPALIKKGYTASEIMDIFRSYPIRDMFSGSDEFDGYLRICINQLMKIYHLI